jgi:diguanylate cyclase
MSKTDLHVAAPPSTTVRPGARLNRLEIARAVLLWTMWLLVAVYVLALALHGFGWGPSWDGWFGSLVDDWLGLLTVWAPAAVCWLAVHRVGLRRPEILLASAAVTSFAVGDTFYLVTSIGGGEVPFPSPADVGYLLVYPLLMAALAVTVRRRARGMATWVWLDCVVGSLGAGAVLAVVLQPVLESATADGLSALATAVALAPPVFDLVLVAAVVGIVAVREVEMGSRWSLLGTGLLVFAATDVLYGLQVTAGTYVLGTVLDAGWALGLALMSTWVDGTTRVVGVKADAPRRNQRAAGLTASSLATLAGLSVLVLSSRMTVPPLAMGLAIGAMLAAGVRAQLASRLLERMAEQRRLAAATDELTGLPNRRALYAEAPTRLAESGQSHQALLMLDLDGFKEVNDNLGHGAGDNLLIQVGARLRKNLRVGDLLVRLGGDEFAVLLDSGRDDAQDTAARLCAAVGEPLVVDETSLRVGVSIGIALFPDDGPDLSVLLRKADIAMYKAKTSRGGHHVYCHADDADGATTLQAVQELRTALSSDQLVLHYQPKVDLVTGRVHSVEALVRWNHPTRGLLCPDAFLSLVEASGLMPSLTRTVLAQALDQAAAWQRAGNPLKVAVNLSASSLSDPDLPGEITTMLAARGVQPSNLQLEITEQFLMRDRALAHAILKKLRESGVTISVDDFGTGYNSLSYLRELPIDELKIDRSFVIPMTHDARTAALVSSTIKLAHSLGLSIVAEGVETAGAYSELTRMGCDHAQGYFMSRPIPAAELTEWLIEWHSSSHTASQPRSTLAPAPAHTRMPDVSEVLAQSRAS